MTNYVAKGGVKRPLPPRQHPSSHLFPHYATTDPAWIDRYVSASIANRPTKG